MAGFFSRISEKFSSDKFIAAILIAAGFFVYANSLSNSFVWDDEEQVVNNTVIRDWNNAGLIFKSSTFYAGGAGLSGGFYRPLVTLSYFWNYSYWGLNPFGYHLTQLLIHCANAFLVFYLLKTIFEKNNIKNGRFAALAAALIFAVHPANVESVAYIGSVGEVMYVFFALLALVFFVKSLDGVKTFAPQLFWGSFGLVFLGFLAKEAAIVVLPLMLVYLLLFLKASRSIYIKFFAGVAAVVVSYAFLRFFVAKIAPVSQFLAPIHGAPLWQRFVTIPYEILTYLGIILFPKDLSIWRHFVVALAADPRFWASLIALVAIAAVLLYYIARTKSKPFFFFALWFAIALAPILNIIPLDMTVAERWLYFPIIGFLGAVSLAVIGGAQKLSPNHQKIALAVFIIAIVALGMRTVARNADWRNGLSLYGHDIALAQVISPQGSFDLENNYGVELFRAGWIDEAGEHFKRSIMLQPKWASSQNNLGAVLERNGDLEGALAQYRIAADMNYYLAYENIAGVLIKMKRHDEAKKFLEESLAKFPDNTRLQFNLALLYAADNIPNKKDAKQKALYLVSLILRADPQNPQAAQLFYMLQNNQKIKL
jgi:tetratricopeptide (TPR) repeat protein